MKEDFQRFTELVNTDESLQKKLEEAVKNYDGEQTEEEVFNAVVVPIAKEAGFSLSLDDVKQSIQELNLDEMAQVGGGANKVKYIKRCNTPPDGSGFGGGFCQVIGVGAFGAFTDKGGVVCLIIGGGWGGENICFEEGFSG